MAGLEERLLGDGGSARSLEEVAVAGAGDESVAVMERRKSFDGRGYEFVQHAVAEGQGVPWPRAGGSDADENLGEGMVGRLTDAGAQGT